MTLWSNLVTNLYDQHSLDYLFQLAVEMKQLGLPWISNVEKVITSSGR